MVYVLFFAGVIDRSDIEEEEDDIEAAMEDIPIFIAGGEVIVRRDATSNTPVASRDSILIVLLNLDGMSFIFPLSLRGLLLFLLLISPP
jgi:hypothetical protein